MAQVKRLFRGPNGIDAVVLDDGTVVLAEDAPCGISLDGGKTYIEPNDPGYWEAVQNLPQVN